MFAENTKKMTISVDKHTPEQMLALDSNIYTNNIIHVILLLVIMFVKSFFFFHY